VVLRNAAGVTPAGARIVVTGYGPSGRPPVWLTPEIRQPLKRLRTTDPHGTGRRTPMGSTGFKSLGT